MWDCCSELPELFTSLKRTWKCGKLSNLKLLNPHVNKHCVGQTEIHWWAILVHELPLYDLYPI